MLKKIRELNYLNCQKNSDAGVARNNSIKHATGRFIAFCDSDDIWCKNKLELQVEFMLKIGATFSYSSYYEITEDNYVKNIVRFPYKIAKSYLLCDCIGCLTVIYDCEKLDKIYMPELRKRQDWGLWLKIIQKSKYAYGIDMPLAYYRVRKNSISSNKFSLIKYNINVYQKVLNFSLLKSYSIFVFLFLPTYFLKMIRKNINRILYMKSRERYNI